MSINRYRPWLAGTAMVFAATLPLGAHAATAPAANYFPNFTPDTARITTAVDTSKLVSVQNSKPTQAVAKYDTGALSSTQTIRNVTLLLKRSDAKQQQFENYLTQLSNPSSPYFHHWLSAQQIGTMFGPAQADITKVEQWLRSQGLKVDSVSSTGMMIHFSGTASTVGQAFHTTLHSYTVKGERHFANTGMQQFPAALAPVVKEVASLDNFFPQPLHLDVGTVSKNKKTGKWQTVSRAASALATPQYTIPPTDLTTGTNFDVVPADFDTIYNVKPLWSEGTPIRGAGQTVAVLERTDVLPADVVTFRQAFLPANAAGAVNYINPVLYMGDTSCPNPGTNGDEGEAALDTEWIGAAAPDANIVFASCDDSQSPTFGPFTAAINLLEGAAPLPSVMSLSYGECEGSGFVDGTADEAGDLWSYAAAEGVTVFVSSGDAGSAGCNQNQSAAFQGVAVNGMGSTPYNVSVGGTDFNDLNSTNQYWTQTNLAYGQSAISYIPEQTWNDSCASSTLYTLLGYSNGVDACNSAAGQNYLNTAGGSGGPSTNWVQPDWQTGIYGSTNYGTRMLPDVSLFAANGLYGHALVYCMSDASEGGTSCDYSNPDNVLYNSAGGTSFAAPAMAGIQALINQAAGQSSGNILPVFYNLATKEYGTNGSPNASMLNSCNSSNGTSVGSSCIFNNVTVGNIDVPCYEGTDDCYTGKGVLPYGVVSAGGSADLAPAWQTNAGYSMATGLGSVNATNLVNAVVKFEQPFKSGYTAPGDFMSSYDEAAGDGYSDIALVDPVKGTLTSLGMKGSIVMQNASQPVTPGYTIGAIGNFFTPGTSQLDLTGTEIAAFAWTGPDNQLYTWLSDGLGGAQDFLPHAIGSPYPAGWMLVGAGTFDGGGTDELLWWNASTGQIGWWKVSFHAFYILGRAQYYFGDTISPITTVAQGYVPTVADVNGDGYADIVWTNPSNNQVYIWINNQQGGFVPRQSTVNRPAGFTLYGAGDLTGNGKTDLIWTNPSTNQMAWWVMDGYNVTDQEVRSVAPGYTMASVADYDGDGLADILWVGTAGDMYEWQSNGNGGFQSFQVTDATGAPYIIPAGAQVQAVRLQGGTVTGGTPGTSIGSSH